jgi:hypothetical protein
MNAISLASRAGAALDAMIPDANRDKIIARLFGVSVRMAQYLRCGKCWTVERLSTATEILGEGTRKMDYARRLTAFVLAVLAGWLARLGRWIAPRGSINGTHA